MPYKVLLYFKVEPAASSSEENKQPAPLFLFCHTKPDRRWPFLQEWPILILRFERSALTNWATGPIWFSLVAPAGVEPAPLITLPDPKAGAYTYSATFQNEWNGGTRTHITFATFYLAKRLNPLSQVVHDQTIPMAACHTIVPYRDTQLDLLSVEQPGIEPRSTDFQSVALTNFATVPVCSMGFEPIPQESNSWMLPLHHEPCRPKGIWTPTTWFEAKHAIRYTIGLVVEPLGVEPKSPRLKARCFPN